MTYPSIRFTSDSVCEVTCSELINGISIENIFHVRSHEIAKESGLTSHLITFHDGGTFRFLYRDDGTMMNCAGRHVWVTFTAENMMILHSYASRMVQQRDTQPPGGSGQSR